MTKFGLHFPGARHPWPFFDLPGSFKGLSDKKLRRIASQIKEVHIPDHTASDCAAFFNLRLKTLKCRVPTLRIDGGPCILRTHCITDWTETFTYTEISTQLQRMTRVTQSTTMVAIVNVTSTIVHATSFAQSPPPLNSTRL